MIHRLRFFELGEKIVERQSERGEQDIEKEEKDSLLDDLKAKKEESKTIVDRTCTTKTVTRSVIGQKEPLAHPKNCKNECPYGYGRQIIKE